MIWYILGYLIFTGIQGSVLCYIFKNIYDIKYIKYNKKIHSLELENDELMNDVNDLRNEIAELKSKKELKKYKENRNKFNSFNYEAIYKGE